MARGHAKGSSFEREICKRLGLWWTGGERDDVFWRSSNSGGRATVRRRVGKQTFGQYGDIQATDPDGQPLMDLMTIEIKRGYNRYTVQDLLDKGPKAAPQIYELFFKQCKEEQKAGCTPYWALIAKRDQREALLFVPQSFIHRLNWVEDILPTHHYSKCVRLYWDESTIVGMALEEFLTHVNKKHILELHKKEFEP